MTKHNITLTDDECEVLHAIFYNTIGGSSRTPRQLVEGIASKLPARKGNYTAGIEIVNRFGAEAVVIRKVDNENFESE